MTAPRLGWWWVPAVVVVAGLVLFVRDEVRTAGFVVAAGVLVGALLRLVLPTNHSGGLAVRSKAVDVLLMTVLGLGLATITAVLDLTPRS